VQLTAAQDTPAIRKSVDAFVTAYNDLNKLLADQTKFNGTDKAASPLQGDNAVVALRGQLRGLLGGTSGASTMFTRLSDIGFDIKQDGSITVNETKMSNALANASETRKLFGNSDTLVPGNDGIATRMRVMSDRLLGIDGTITQRSDGLRKRIDLNKDRQDSLTDRIAMTEKRLRAQYTALDRQMGQLSSLSGYITQQIAAFSNKG
jgi:flagellar hook-associated protein 2